MARRVLLGKEGSNYVLKISKPGVDLIDDTVNDRDLLFNSQVYRAGTIRAASTYTSITSNATLATTEDSTGAAYIPAYIITEGGTEYPQAYFDYFRGTSSSFDDLYGQVIGALPTNGGGGLFEYSLLSSGTTKNKVTPRFFDMNEYSDPRPGEEGAYPSFPARTSTNAVEIRVLGIPCQYGKMTNSTTLFGNSVLTSTASGGSGSGSGGSIQAPTITSVSLSSRTSSNDTVTVNASSGTGNSGTITYAQTSTVTTPSTGFQTSTNFSQPRNTTRYYWAKQSTYTSSSTTFASPAYDGTPSAFTFTDVSSAQLSTVSTSNQITVAGLANNDIAVVTITGGTFSKNGGAYTSTATTAADGNTFTVRVTSSGSYSTAVSTTLNIGTVSDTYTVTTGAEPADTQPNAFDFTNQTGLELSTLTYSNTVTIAGINQAVAVSATNGAQFSIAGGGYATSGNITSGQTLRIRLTSSGSYSTNVATTITVGSTTDAWTITTRAAVAATTPTNIVATQTSNTSATSQNLTVTGSGGSGTTQVSSNNSTWVSNGSAFSQNRNSTVTYYARNVGETTSASYSETKFIPPVVTLLGIGNYVNRAAAGENNTYGVTVQRANGNFNTYSASWGTVTTSISNNSGGWLTSTITNSAAGNFNLTSSSNSSTSSRTATVTYTTFTQFGYQHVITFTFQQDGIAADTTPNAFTFTDTFGATQGQTYTSAILVQGINSASALTFSGTTGADYKVNSGSYVTSGQNVSNGNTVTVRIVAASSAGVGRTGTVTIGGVSDTMTVGTSADLVPNQFDFGNGVNLTANEGATANELSGIVTLSGMTPSATTTATYSGSSYGTFSVNGGTYSQTSKSVVNGNTLRIKIAGQLPVNNGQTGTVTVGGISDSFIVSVDPEEDTTD